MTDLLEFDRKHVWHPYTSMRHPLPVYPVESASGVKIKLADSSELIDGTSSWWAAIHGYNHPFLNEAVKRQLEKMSHVMFGGLTHEPAITLAQKLVAMTPASLTRVFFADSGSVSVEVAIKMALQYWQGLGRTAKTRMLTVRSGYHGDTFGAMAVCDPVGGMHSLFSGVLTQHIFAEAPRCRFDDPWDEDFITDLRQKLETHHEQIAAVIIEPILQGAGGMRMYSPHYLKRLRELCDSHNVLLIFDEVATGFGRTGELFAMHHAGVDPDIACFGKGLTGGYMTLAAVMANDRVSDGISSGNPPEFMHGPTFMANPLACAVANASLELLQNSDWREKVAAIEKTMRENLAPAIGQEQVADVRVLGAVGAIEMKQTVNVAKIQQFFVDSGVWIRPFDKLIYIMPPYIIGKSDLEKLCAVMVQATGISN